MSFFRSRPTYVIQRRGCKTSTSSFFPAPSDKFAPEFVNGIGESAAYRKFYHFWEKWLSASLAGDGPILSSLQKALGEVLATRHVYEQDSVFGALQHIIPRLLDQRADQSLDLRKVAASFRARLNFAPMRDSFYVVPML